MLNLKFYINSIQKLNLHATLLNNNSCMIQGILFIKTNKLFLFFDAQFCNLKLLFFTCKFIRSCKLEYVKKIFAIFYKKET